MMALLASCSLGGDDEINEQTNSLLDSASNLFSPVEGQEGLLSSEPTIMRGRVVTIDFSLLVVLEEDSEVSEVTFPPVGLNFFEDVRYIFILDRQETNVLGVITWIGHIEGVELSEVTLSVIENVMSGSIILPGGEIYRIAFLSESMHAVYQIDQSAFPEEEAPDPLEDTPLLN
ncbi:MAG: hypothetical protein FVQ83_17145 [Chloroflexi bacterium]|nr:hypothetical protein [Chloroflexota bacterium]